MKEKNYIWTKNRNKKRARAWVLGVKSDPKLSFYFEWPSIFFFQLRILPSHISVPQCVERETSFNGYDIRFVTGVLSWEDCRTQCQNEPRCLFWTLVTSLGKCYLKTSDAGRRALSGRISGMKRCIGYHFFSSLYTLLPLCYAPINFQPLLFGTL